MHRFFDGDYSRRLSVHLKEEFTGSGAQFHYSPEELCLVVSGDLTYRGTVDEFKRVDSFLTELSSEIKIPKPRIVLAPGNHDVHWPSAKNDAATRFDNYVSFLGSFYGESTFRQLYPLITWDFRVDTSRPRPEELVGFHTINDILFVSMNSCVYETDQDHYGFVGGQQLRSINNLLERSPATPIARIACASSPSPSFS